MRALIAISVAAVTASVFLASPSFAQRAQPNLGTKAGQAAGAPAARQGAPANAGQRGGNPGANFRGAGRAGNPGAFSGGSPNRQAWRGDGRRYGGGYNRGYRGGYGGGVFFGAVPYYGSPYAYDDNDYVEGPAPAGGDVGYCMSRFKSYDPASGTYLGFDGMRHPCP